MLSENYVKPQTWHLPVDGLLVPEVPLHYSGYWVCVRGAGGMSFDHNLMLVSLCITATEHRIFPVLVYADSFLDLGLTSLQCGMM